MIYLHTKLHLQTYSRGVRARDRGVCLWPQAAPAQAAPARAPPRAPQRRRRPRRPLRLRPRRRRRDGSWESPAHPAAGMAYAGVVEIWSPHMETYDTHVYTDMHACHIISSISLDVYLCYKSILCYVQLAMVLCMYLCQCNVNIFASYGNNLPAQTCHTFRRADIQFSKLGC